jgi:hypothetical protein
LCDAREQAGLARWALVCRDAGEVGARSHKEKPVACAACSGVEQSSIQEFAASA